MKLKPLCILILSLSFAITGFAQDPTPADSSNVTKIRIPIPPRFYTGNNYDFAILSTAAVSKPGASSQLTTPRFTALVNFGFNFHYDVNRYFGWLFGIDVKNIGFIEKEEELTIKRRVYTVGVPVGFKVGDLRNRNFFFAGGGADVPLNYREKVFERRGDKEKFNEWFSDRTPRILPYVFVGHSWDPGIVVKLQYYPGNFLNESFTEDRLAPGQAAYKPYDGYKVHLLLLSVGLDIHYGQYKMQNREYWQWRKKQKRNDTGK